MGAVDDSLDFSDIGLPSSVGLAVGMGVVVPEGNALTADCALSHSDTPPSWILNQVNEPYYSTAYFKMQEGFLFFFAQKTGFFRPRICRIGAFPLFTSTR
jgi:hypothetical protein